MLLYRSLCNERRNLANEDDYTVLVSHVTVT